MHVLLIEHDNQLAQVLTTVLHANGHSVSWHRYSTGTAYPPADTDIILLDLGIPDADGLRHLRTLRANTDAPVLVLSARRDEPSVVQALHHGADDYLAKPLRMDELIARMHAARRRAARHAELGRSLRVGDIHINPHARTVTIDTSTSNGTNGGEGGGDDAGAARPDVRLTRKEFDILLLLARRAGEAVSRREILHQVWGSDHAPNSGALSVHMNALRTKLNQPHQLHTIHGYGYRLGGLLAQEGRRAS